jgi:hypothetical protein
LSKGLRIPHLSSAFSRDNTRQSIIRAERLAAELIENIDRLFAPLPLDEGNKAQRARAVTSASVYWRIGAGRTRQQWR